MVLEKSLNFDLIKLCEQCFTIIMCIFIITITTVSIQLCEFDLIFSATATALAKILLHLKVRKAQFGHFRKACVRPKQQMCSFSVTKNALLHPGTV